MPDKPTLKAQFDQDHTERREILETASLCASLSKPNILPPSGQKANERLPEKYQSLCSRGLANLSGKMLMALYPAGFSWFSLELAPEFEFNPNTEATAIQAGKQKLWLDEVVANSKLDSTSRLTRRGRRGTGFRTHKRAVLDQILATGDSLEMMTSDYRLKQFRRDMYVTRRNSPGEVLYHITRQKLDSLSMTTEMLDRAGLEPEQTDPNTDPGKRVVDIYTRCQWQPLSKMWLIEQEVNDNIIAESTEPVSPFFSTAFELAPEEHYGRGFIELNLGDARSLNELSLRILDFAAVHSKILWAKDYSSNIRDVDFAKPSGEVIQARVSGGAVQDAAILQANNAQSFQVVGAAHTAVHSDLSKAMLIESEITPTGERVTAMQVQRVAQELDGALGGVYAPIADEQQIPMLRRLMWQLQRDQLILPVQDGAVEMNAKTGLAALSSQSKANDMLTFAQIITQLPPQVAAKIDWNVFTDILVRVYNISERGLIKSKEQMDQEAVAAEQAAMAQEATAKGIDVIGNITETQATQEQGAA